MRSYYVYIVSSISRTLYTGITNDLQRRVYEHKHELVPGFTAKYGVKRLVYFEDSADVHAAIAREKQIKAWTRAKRVALVESMNPKWDDLSAGWYDDTPAGSSVIPSEARNPCSGPGGTDPSLRSG